MEQKKKKLWPPHFSLAYPSLSKSPLPSKLPSEGKPVPESTGLPVAFQTSRTPEADDLLGPPSRTKTSPNHEGATSPTVWSPETALPPKASKLQVSVSLLLWPISWPTFVPLGKRWALVGVSSCDASPRPSSLGAKRLEGSTAHSTAHSAAALRLHSASPPWETNWGAVAVGYSVLFFLVWIGFIYGYFGPTSFRSSPFFNFQHLVLKQTQPWHIPLPSAAFQPAFVPRVELHSTVVCHGSLAMNPNSASTRGPLAQVSPRSRIPKLQPVLGLQHWAFLAEIHCASQDSQTLKTKTKKKRKTCQQ